jgi:hypothetical protein
MSNEAEVARFGATIFYEDAEEQRQGGCGDPWVGEVEGRAGISHPFGQFGEQG